MLKKILGSLSLGLLLIDLGYAQDLPSRISTSEEGKLHGQPANIITDTRLPLSKNVTFHVTSESIPTTVSDSKKYDVILYPFGKELGFLEYAEPAYQLEFSFGKKSGSLPIINGIPVGIDYPAAYLDHFHEQKYGVVEMLVKNAVELAEKDGYFSKDASIVKIALASFYHPVYLQDAEALAFHMVSATDEQLRLSKSGKIFEVTILSNHNPDVENAFKNEIEYRKTVTREFWENVPEENRQRTKIAYIAAKTPDQAHEMAYYLNHWDKELKANRLSYFQMKGPLRVITPQDFVEVLLDFKDHHGYTYAPAHVVEAVQEMIFRVTRYGHINMSMVEGVVKELAEKEFAKDPEKDKLVQSRTSKIMEYLRSSETGSFAKMSVFDVIFREKTSSRPVWEAIERMTKK